MYGVPVAVEGGQQQRRRARGRGQLVKEDARGRREMGVIQK